MAGGNFDKSVGKVRPGTYINFIDNSNELVSGSERGTVIIPLKNTDYGPAKKMITISADALDAQKPLLGYSVYDDDASGNMLLIREAFKGANKVIVYICTEGTAAATGTGGGMKVTAKYKGTRGNSISFSSVANPVSGYDVEVYLDGSRVETFEQVSQVSDIGESSYVTFATDGSATAISAVAGVTLSGGTSGTTQNADVTAFLDDSESVTWNTMAFPFDDSALQAAVKAKIKNLREKVGKGVQAVCPDYDADYEGIINVTNSYALSDRELTTVQAVAYVAGITAGASNVKSNTHVTVDGAVSVVGVKTYEAAETAIKNGEFFFSVSESGDVVVEYDINSLKTFTTTKGKHYSKNRVIRVFDTFQEAVQNNFPPNKYDNDADGWNIMKGIGASILKQFGPRSAGGVGAIKNIDYDTDFTIDEESSTGDQTFFNVGLEPVDSAEKLYFTVNTR